MLEGGMGSHMPRFGLMHYLACFTLFDGDPNRINTMLDGFRSRDAGADSGGGEEISRAEQSRHRASPADCEKRGSVRMKPAKRKWSSEPVREEFLRYDRRATAAQECRPGFARERPVAWPKRTVRTLSNGMEVVLAESRTFPKITAQLFFRSGTRRWR